MSNFFYKPPKIARMLINLVTEPEERFSIVGDLEEEFNLIIQNNGKFRAKLWYLIQVMKSVIPIIINSTYRSYIMITNYFKVALRNIRKQKGYSFINILGLSMGMACCILIYLWVDYERSFDKFNENINELYHVPILHKYGDDRMMSPGAPPALGPALKNEYPEIINSVRTLELHEQLIRYGDKSYKEKIRMADPSIMEMFTFPFLEGNVKTAFSIPEAIIISEKMAEKFFGSEDPIGKILNINKQYDFQVTGIFKNIPDNSYMQFEFLINIEFARTLWGKDHLNKWSNCSFNTIVQLRKNSDYRGRGSYRAQYSAGIGCHRRCIILSLQYKQRKSTEPLSRNYPWWR